MIHGEMSANRQLHWGRIEFWVDFYRPLKIIKFPNLNFNLTKKIFQFPPKSHGGITDDMGYPAPFGGTEDPTNNAAAWIAEGMNDNTLNQVDQELEATLGWYAAQQEDAQNYRPSGVEKLPYSWIR